MKTRRVTFVADQLLGYFRTGGLGTATTFLALALGRMGHDVEVLYFGEIPTEPVDREWTNLYAKAGVRIRPLPRVERAIEPSYFARMREVELALRTEPPDVVIAQDIGAPAYSALRLHRLGLAFENTLFVVFCHGTRQWIADMTRKVRVLPGALGVSRLEQASIELADVAVSPSSYMIDWMRGQGWRLPDTTLVINLLTRSAATGEAPEPVKVNGDRPLERVAFFGRLEERKGVRPFVVGLNALPPELLQGIELEFLGRATKNFTPDRVQTLLSEPARRAFRRVSFETELDQHEVLARLSRPGTLAVMPSLEDNSPNAVYECLERRIPFLAGRAGGTSELVAPEDRDRVLIEPTAEGVAAALQTALAGDSVPRPAQPAFDNAVSLERWAEVLERRPRRTAPSQERPAVDVVIVQRAAGAGLDRCLAALSAQSYGKLSVISSEGASVERAREAGLEKGEAAWVVFLDEEDVPEPELVETLVRAQAASGADVVTCGVRVNGTEHFFAGEPGGLGLLGNGYGTVALVRRSLLGDLTTPWPVVGDHDWPLLARLSAEGARIVSVPLPLAKRARPPGTLDGEPSDGLLAIEHLERALPGQLRLLARLAAGLAAEMRRPPPASSGGLAWRALRRLLR